MRQLYQLGGQQQDISQKNTIQRQLIGDFFEKFHFSLVVARLAGILVERIKNRKTKEKGVPNFRKHLVNPNPIALG